MGNAQTGESLWLPWEGEDSTSEKLEGELFYTLGHVDLDDETVRASLAVALQRTGVVDGLGRAFSALNDPGSLSHHWYMGHVGGEFTPAICNHDGVTIYDEEIDEDQPQAITLVEVMTDGN